MDPDANLEEQLRIANAILHGQSGEEYQIGDIDRLAELVIALHEWMNTGGFAPAKWKRA